MMASASDQNKDIFVYEQLSSFKNESPNLYIMVITGYGYIKNESDCGKLLTKTPAT